MSLFQTYLEKVINEDDVSLSDEINAAGIDEDDNVEWKDSKGRKMSGQVTSIDGKYAKVAFDEKTRADLRSRGVKGTWVGVELKDLKKVD